MNAPDFETMIKTARLKWIEKAVRVTDAPWKLILESYLEKLDVHLNVLMYSNYNLKSVNLDKGTLPVFYKEMLQLWCDNGNSWPEDKVNLLWYNKDICINGKSLFYEDFFRAGAWYVNDLYSNDGSVVPFQTWVSRGVGRYNMIKWMGLIQKTRKMHTGRDEPTNEVKLLYFQSKGPIAQLNNKVIYNGLLASKIPHTTNIYVPRTAKHLGNDISWKEVYVRAYRTPIDTKTKDFQYRFIHDLLSNKYWLHKWGIKDTAACYYCNNEEENIVHMFWSCPKTRQFWQELSEFCQNRSIIQEDICIDDVFIGVNEDTLCTIIFVAKTFIYNKRIHDQQFTFNPFLIFLSKFKLNEFSIAKANNTIEDWLEKWKFLPD